MGNTTAPPPRSPGAVPPLTRSHLPNMASASWLWRICRGDKANQKRWNILNESVRNSYNLFWKCGCGYFDRSSVEKFKILTMVSFALEIWTSINLKSGFQILPKKKWISTPKRNLSIFHVFSSLPFGKLMGTHPAPAEPRSVFLGEEPKERLF